MTDAPPQGRPDPKATADYIQELTGELSQLANEAGLDLLAYLLDMVCVEAKLVKARPSKAAAPTREEP